MRFFAIALLSIYLLSLGCACAHLCADRLLPEAKMDPTVVNAEALSHPFDAFLGDADKKAAEGHSHHECEACPCLCHAVAAIPDTTVFNVAGACGNALFATFSAVSTHPPAPDRPPILS